MSFLSKAVTKKRIEPVTIRPESTIDPSVWEPTASPQVMAAVLDSALRLSLVGVVSRTQRGTFLRNERMPGLAGGRVTASFPSQIVIHRGANRTWLVSQGLFLRDGQTFIDWTVAVKLEETGVFTVATPEYLTIDGALAHSHNYSELRNALEVSLRAVGSMVSIAEQEIASSELAKPLPGGFAGHVGERQIPFSVVVGMSASEIRSRLDFEIGLPLTSKGDDNWRYGLGLEQSWNENWIDVRLTSAENGAGMSGLINVGAPVGGIADECASHSARMSFLTFSEMFNVEDALFKMTPASFQEAVK